MTVTTTAVKTAYTGDNGTVAFPTVFQFWETDELDVYLRTISTGVEALQVLAVDYTVTGGAGSNGTVTFTTAPTTLVEVHIRRNTVRDQQKDITPLTKFPSAATEQALDRAAMAAQEENADRTERFLRIPVTDIPVDPLTAPDMELPSTVARAVTGAVLGFNAEGEPIITTAGLDTALTTEFTLTLLDDADADEALATLSAVKNAGDVDKLDAGTLAAREPVAATFGEGLYVSTDDRSLWYSNATAWSEIGIMQIGNATLPTPATIGKLVLDTNNLIIKRDDTIALVDLKAPLARGSLGGLGTSVVATNDIQIEVGECRVGTGTGTGRSIANAYLSTVLTKQLDATWAAGTAAGGLAAGVAVGASKWYHIFLLMAPDGTVDAGFDTSVEAANLLADAAVIAAGHTMYRRIASRQETAAGTGAWKAQSQLGDEFLLDLPVRDVSNLDVTVAAGAAVLDTMSTPLGVQVGHIGAWSLTDTSTGGTSCGLLVTSPDQADTAPAAATMFNLKIVSATIVSINSSTIVTRTDASSRVRHRSENVASVVLDCFTMGWIDDRGRWD